MPILTLYLERLATPIGELLLFSNAENVLYAADWSDYQERLKRQLKRLYPTLAIAPCPTALPSAPYAALQHYFQGETAAIDDIAVCLTGTKFQLEVWQALREIPNGSHCSYADLAWRIQRPKAVRAVGMANSMNPISIVVPCHRVIGKNQRLVGYAGGLERKRWLLQHENQSPTLFI